jgi:hypothetical protein
VTDASSPSLGTPDKDLLARYADEVLRIWNTRSYLLLLSLGVLGMGVAAWRGTTERKIVARDLAAEQKGVLSDALARVDGTRRTIDARLLDSKAQNEGMSRRLDELAARQDSLAVAFEVRGSEVSRFSAQIQGCCRASSDAGSAPLGPELIEMRGALAGYGDALAGLGLAQDRQAREVAELRGLIQQLLARLERQERTGEISYIVRESSERELINPPVNLILGRRSRKDGSLTLTIRGRDGQPLASATFDLVNPKPLPFRVGAFEYEASPIYLEPRWLLKDRLAIVVRRVPKS